VHFPGRQPKEQVPALLAESEACRIHLRGCELSGTVIPSKIFETMAMGRSMPGEARRRSHADRRAELRRSRLCRPPLRPRRRGRPVFAPAGTAGRRWSKL